MTYFDPKIYNMKNLKEKDRKELKFWREIFDRQIENAMDMFIPYVKKKGKMKLWDRLKKELAEDFAGEIKSHMRAAMTEIIVSIMDRYEDDYFESLEIKESNQGKIENFEDKGDNKNGKRKNI